MASKVPVRRVVSQTPLAKGYERAVLGLGRARRPIPWDRFERSKYPEAALALAEDAATRLAEGEYYAVGLFGRITSGVAMVRAPFDLVQAVSGIGPDEVRHADYCARFASLCRGEEATLSIDPGALDAATSAIPTAHDTDFLVAKYAATGETLAAALLAACRKRAKDPVARALFSSLLADEVHHARVGWCYLAWRAPMWTLAERQAVADRLGEFIQDVERSLWSGRDATESARAAADALGVLDSASQREVVRRVMEDEIVPAHDALGLGASHAYRARNPMPSAAMPAPGFVFVRASGAAPTGAAPNGAGGLRAFEPATSAKPAHRENTPKRAIERAAGFLRSCVTAEGHVPFSVDALTGAISRSGPFRHGRAAVVIHALGNHESCAGATALARDALHAEIERALASDPVSDWPTELPHIQATLALAVVSGVDVRDRLVASLTASSQELDAWTAAQIVTALGASAPEAVWSRAVAGLEREPWAPWTARAALARGDANVAERVATLLVAAVRADGSVWGLDGPEIPRTAATLEVLSAFDTEAARSACDRAGRFLLRVQLDLDSADGAFPLFPRGRQLRLDATGHALAGLDAWQAAIHPEPNMLASSGGSVTGSLRGGDFKGSLIRQ